MLQGDVEALLHADAHQLDQPQHVAAAGTWVDEDAVGVAVAYLGPADLRPRQALMELITMQFIS